MARGGVYKTEIEKARNALLAEGKHPSVDAVRVALGNTGSKTTIHRYLRVGRDSYKNRQFRFYVAVYKCFLGLRFAGNRAFALRCLHRRILGLKLDQQFLNRLQTGFATSLFVDLDKARLPFR